MSTIDFPMKYQVANIRYQEMLDEAAKQRRIKELRKSQIQVRRSVMAEVRAAVANALFRAGSWLMPDEVGGLELRPGR